MSYTLKFSGTDTNIIVPAMPPGINAVDTSLSLVGRGYPNYGEKIAQNFLYLLENFANQDPPKNPIIGQLWYDTSDSNNKVLRVLDGTNWPTVSGIYQQSADPKLSPNQGLKQGDIWVDTSKNQLKIYNFGNWTTVGPSTSTDTGAFVATLSSLSGGTHDVILNKAEGNVISIVSNNAFTIGPDIPQEVQGFKTLTTGTNLVPGSILNGISSSTYNLSIGNSIFPVSSFLRKDNQGGETITGVVQFITPSTAGPGSAGVVIRKSGDTGLAYIQFYKNVNDAVVTNATPGGKIIFKTKGPTDNKDLLTDSVYIEKSLVKINVDTPATSTNTGALVVAGGVGIGGNLHIGKKLYVNAINLNTATISLSNTAVSNSTDTGVLTVAGGVGIGGNLNVGGIIGLDSNFYLTKIAANPILAFNPNSYLVFNRSNSQYYFYVTATTVMVMDKNYVLLPNTATSTSTTTGALLVAGGVGIGGNLNVGSTSSVFANSYIGENTSTTYIGGYDKWLVLDGIPKEAPVGIAGIELRGGSYSGNGTQSQINFVARATNGTDANSGRIELTNSANKTNTGIMKIYTAGFSSGLVEALRIDDSQIVSVQSNEISTSTNTGALLVAGGVGIGGAVNIGKTSTIAGARILTTATSSIAYPEDFGAVGNGNTNDYGALQAAIDTGKSVYLTDGKTYYYTTGLTLNNNYQRFGGPGVLKPSGSINGVTIGGGSEGVEVDLTFNSPNFAGCAVRVDNANRVTIKKLHGVDIGTATNTSSILYVQKSNTCVVEWMWARTGGKGITWYGTDTTRSDILRINFAVLDCADDQYGLDWDGNCHSLEIGYLGLVTTKGVIVRNTAGVTTFPAIGRFNHIEIDYPTSHGIEIAAGLDFDINIPYILGAGIRYATVLNAGTSYEILYPGNTVWTGIGAANNNIGTVFTASGPAPATSDTGFAKEAGKTFSGIKIGSTTNNYQVRINGGKSIGNTGYGIENAGGVVYFDGTTDLSDNRLGRTTGTVWTTLERLTLDDDNFYLTMNTGNPLVALSSNSTMSFDRTNKQLNFTIDGSGSLQVAKTYVQTFTPLITPTYTVGTLPPGVQGMRAFVTDASTSTFYASVAGGGSLTVPVFYDGSNWLIG